MSACSSPGWDLRHFAPARLDALERRRPGTDRLPDSVPTPYAPRSRPGAPSSSNSWAAPADRRCVDPACRPRRADRTDPDHRVHQLVQMATHIAQRGRHLQGGLRIQRGPRPARSAVVRHGRGRSLHRLFRRKKPTAEEEEDELASTPLRAQLRSDHRIRQKIHRKPQPAHRALPRCGVRLGS